MPRPWLTRRLRPSVRGAALAALRRTPDCALQEDGITCLGGGRAFRQMTNTHLAAHGLTADSSRETWGTPRHHNLLCGEGEALWRVRAIRNQRAARIRQRRLNPLACLGLTQRPAAIQRRVAATDDAARE